MPDVTTRIVILHSSAERAVKLYRLFTGFGYDVASNWPVEELSKQVAATLPVSPQTAVYDNETLVKQARHLGGNVCAADAVLVDAGSDRFWAGFASGLRAKEGPFPTIVYVGPPGDSIGVQLLVNNASRRTLVGHVSEWSDVPTALNNLGIYPKTLVPENVDVRDSDPPVVPEQPVVADRPEHPDRDPVHGGES